MGQQRRGSRLAKHCVEVEVVLGHTLQVYGSGVVGRVRRLERGLLHTGEVAVWAPLADDPSRPVNVGIVSSDPGESQDQGQLRLL